MDIAMVLACCAQIPQKQTVASRVLFVCLKCGRGQTSKYRKSGTDAIRAWEVDPAPWDGGVASRSPQPVVGNS